MSGAWGPLPKLALDLAPTPSYPVPDTVPGGACAELRLLLPGATAPPSLPDPALYCSSGLQVGANKALIDCPEGRALLPGRLLSSAPRQGFAGKGGGGGRQTGGGEQSCGGLSPPVSTRLCQFSVRSLDCPRQVSPSSPRGHIGTPEVRVGSFPGQLSC